MDAGENGRPATGDAARQLPETAQRLVAAARRVLARQGFAGLTVDAVAVESGEYRDAIRYYFGGKAGLITAVVESLAHDQSLDAMRKARALGPGETRVGVLIDADRAMAEDSPGFRDFYEVLPHALKDDDLRARIAALYDWYRSVYVQGLADRSVATTAPDRGRLHLFASLMTAMVDGLALQKALDPEHVDLGALFGLWDEMLEAMLVREREGGE